MASAQYTVHILIDNREEDPFVKLQFGERELELGSKYLTELRESNDIVRNPEALRKRIEDDGYLLIRGLHEQDAVLAARRQILELMQQVGALDPSRPLMEGAIAREGRGRVSARELAKQPAFLDLVNSARIMSFFEHFLGGTSRTYDHKWLRAVPTGQNTGVHYDIVYMGRGTKNVYTVWTPIGDTPMEMGTLAICLGSHRAEGFEKIKETYGQMDVDRDHIEGWFSKDPVEVVEKFGGRWATTSFKAGDAIIFGMFTMHGSLNNRTDRWRISCDTRYQLASEPIDERWVEGGQGHSESSGVTPASIAEARTKWGVA